MRTHACVHARQDYFGELGLLELPPTRRLLTTGPDDAGSPLVPALATALRRLGTEMVMGVR